MICTDKSDRRIHNYICTQCGKRGNTLNIDVKGVKGNDEIRNDQLKNMEIKCRDHNIKKSSIPFIKTKEWKVIPLWDDVLKKTFWFVCQDSGQSMTGYTIWKPITKDKVSEKEDFLYIECPKCKERVYL